MSARNKISPEMIETVATRLAANQRVRCALPGAGRLHLDRPLPFLCVYRYPPDEASFNQESSADREYSESGNEAGTARLVLGESSYLIVSGDHEHAGDVAALVNRISDIMADRFGAFLLLELWAGPPLADAIEAGAKATFRLCSPLVGQSADETPVSVRTLAEALERMVLPGYVVAAEITCGRCARPGLPPLLTTSAASQRSCLMIGLEVPPVYLDATGTIFPAMLRLLHRALSRALQQTFFTFMHVQTVDRPQNYQMLGRRAVVSAVWDVDRELAAISESFNLLLAVTPVNAEAAWREFQTGNFQRAPNFHYRLLPVDPDLLKRQLYNIPLEQLEDPALAHLFRDKRLELDRQITLLEDRDTPRFLPGSLQLYGGVSDRLLRVAIDLLHRIPPRRRPSPNEIASDETTLDAAAFAARARAEIDYYRAMYPAMTARVEIRGDVPGMLVSGGDLLIGQRTRLRASRAEALLQHEIGTHVLTYYNGQAQPLRQLYCGLPGYDTLQEGTATLAEYLVGGLQPARLRYLAARVVAARRLIEGATFVETFRELHHEFEFSRHSAYTITMRVYRGGGFVKDAVYLRGLIRLLIYLKGDNPLEPLFIGKISADYIGLIEDLQWRDVLRPVPLWPRYMDDPAALERLHRVRRGMTVFDLVEP